MAQQTISYLKSRFQTGEKPTQQDYADIFDSYVHYSDLETANNTAIDARISAYDSDLRTLSGYGSAESLGDLLDIFVGYDTSERLVSVLNGLGGSPAWDDVQQKPERVAVSWDEVQVSLDSFIASLSNQPATPVNSSQLIQATSVATTIGGIPAEKKAIIRDMQITFYRTKWEGSSFTTWGTRINSITFAVEPRISLT